MHAEVTFTFKADLEPDTDALLTNRLGASADRQACINLTALAGLRTLSPHVSFATHSNSAVRLFFRGEARVVKIHIQSTRRCTLKGMRREIDDTISDMERLAKQAGTRLKSIRAIVGVEDCDLQQMHPRSFKDKLVVSATENIWPKVYVPLATFVVTYMTNPTGTDYKKAGFNALVAVAATMVWVVFDAVVLQPSTAYSEV
ncbi:hypothetical protein SAMN05446635_2477 [Burkholderia sp. OK233]|nr:hypothetical protein SAMN05446635_2477 [Burkholderia sp. OK233]